MRNQISRSETIASIPNTWIDEELLNSTFKDERLTKRFVSLEILDDLANNSNRIDPLLSNIK